MVTLWVASSIRYSTRYVSLHEICVGLSASVPPSSLHCSGSSPSRTMPRGHRQRRVSVCGCLVDVYCLGVKNALGPDIMNERDLPAVLSQLGDRIHPPYAYTLGLTHCGLPELVVTGMALPQAAALLNRAAAHVVHAEPPAPGERIALIGGPSVEIVELAHPDAHLDTAVALFGPELRALQLVWADDRGHWPWERGFRGRRGGQPVLGQRRSAAR